MKSGIELITQERQEQIEKHGFSVVKDAEFYEDFELIQAALFCIDQATETGFGLKTGINWPKAWGIKFKKKILAKDRIGQLKVAGAFIAAEIDRLQNEPKASNEA